MEIFREIFEDYKKPTAVLKKIEKYLKDYDITVTHNDVRNILSYTEFHFNNGNDIGKIDKLAKELKSKFSIPPYLLTSGALEINVTWKGL